MQSPTGDLRGHLGDRARRRMPRDARAAYCHGSADGLGPSWPQPRCEPARDRLRLDRFELWE